VPDELPIDRTIFRESEDGATVFFPWGLPHRGYRLDETASRAVSFLVASVIAVGTWSAYALESIFESEATGLIDVLGVLAAPGAALLLVLISYAFWVSRFVERFPESDLEVSREERLREAAELVEPWKLALIGVVVSGLSVSLIWLQPRTWWIGLLGVAIGVGVLWWSSLLRRAATGAPR
jgi:hypothetical protein